MSLNRYATRRDVTEPAIVKDLRKCGFLVYRLDFPDLVVKTPRGIKLLEVEGITKYRRRSLKQLQFIKEWEISLVKNTEEALKALYAA